MNVSEILNESELKELRQINNDDADKGIFFDEKGQQRVQATVFAKWFMQNVYFFFVASTAGQTLKYLYDDKGFYREVSDDIFKGAIKENLPSGLQKVRTIKEIFDLLKMEKSVYVSPEFVNADENIINFQNGIYHLDSKEITPHSPNILSTIQMPCNYVKEFKAPERFMQFISTLATDTETVQLLVEFAGLALSNIKGSRTKSALFLVGAGDTGKSVFRRLLSELVGVENDTAIDLEALEGRFGSSQLLFKRLAGSNDMKFATVGQLGMLKQLTGGDRIYAEKKGKDGFTMRFDGLLCFCTNQMPKFGGDKGEHVYRRIMIVECNNVIPSDERDPMLLEKLLEEREDIVAICINQLQSFIKRGYRFELPKRSKKALNLYRIENDNILEFLEECTEPVPEDCKELKYSTSKVYDIYCRWCTVNNDRRAGRKEFYKRIVEQGKGNRKVNGGTYYYTDFRIKYETAKDFIF